VLVVVIPGRQCSGVFLPVSRCQSLLYHSTSWGSNPSCFSFLQGILVTVLGQGHAPVKPRLAAGYCLTAGMNITILFNGHQRSKQFVGDR